MTNHNWVGVVSKGNLDRPFESMDVAIVARSLVMLVLPHQGNKLLCGPSLGLEIVVVRSRGTRVHLGCGRQSGMLQRAVENPTMKLILLPPPRIWAQGTTALRPPSHSEGRE